MSGAKSVSDCVYMHAHVLYEPDQVTPTKKGQNKNENESETPDPCCIRNVHDSMKQHEAKQMS